MIAVDKSKEKLPMYLYNINQITATWHYDIDR